MLQATWSPFAVFCRHGHPLAATRLATLEWLYGRQDNQFISAGPNPSSSSWRPRLLPFCPSGSPNSQHSAALAQTPHQVALSHLPSPKPPPAAMTSLSLVRMRPRHRPMMELHCHRPQGSPSDFSRDWKKKWRKPSTKKVMPPNSGF